MQGTGPNAFAACAGRPGVPAFDSAPSSARAAAPSTLGHLNSGGSGSAGGGGGGFAVGSPTAATAAGLLSPAVAHSAPAVPTVCAATPLVAPSAASGVATAPSPDGCATIGPEIRAAAADPAVTGTLAAAAAALHCEGEVPHVMLPSSEAAEAGAAASLAYALPRALWPPAPVAVAAQRELLPAAAATAEQQLRPPCCAEDEAPQAGGVAGVAAVAALGKVTPQVDRPSHIFM